LEEGRLVELALIVCLGIGAKWLAWRLHLPSILLLLLIGFIVGPLLGWVRPDALLGETLPPVVALFVAVVLFEGGLSLRLSELPAVWPAVRNLIVIGAPVTWLGAGYAAHALFGLDPLLSALIGAIFIVTGPTVIVPLLHHVRPKGNVGAVLKWEGIGIDPVGAMLAVLVFQVMVLPADSGRGPWIVALLVVAKTIGAGVVLGGGAAAILIALLRRSWVPDFLQAAVTLLFVLAAFTASNVLQKESGLLAVTLMGFMIANQKHVDIRPIVHFKENLNVLLISGLFILLAARLDPAILARIDPRYPLFLAALILVVRPLAIALSGIGTGLTWRERAYLCCMAPRGIVAAAVASVLSFELLAHGYAEEQVEVLVPLTFTTITGTVLFYGLIAKPAARWFGVSSPAQDGFLILGAHRTARAIGRALVARGKSVRLVDSNYGNVAAARLEGLPATNASILSDAAHEDLALEGIGTLLALTPNDEVNTLACLRFAELFGRGNVFQLAPARLSAPGERAALGGRPLFERGIGFAELERRFEDAGELRATGITDRFGLEEWREMHEGTGLPLFAVAESGAVRVLGPEGAPPPRPGETVIGLVRARRSEHEDESVTSPVRAPGPA